MRSLFLGTATVLLVTVSAPVRAACNDPPTSRYVLSGPQVYDKESGLRWQRCSAGQKWDGKRCVGTIKMLAPNEVWTLEGWGWRVPTSDELATLISPTCKDPAINEDVFPDMEPYKLEYASADGNSYAGTVDFFDGSVRRAFAGGVKGGKKAVRLIFNEQ